MIGVARCTVAPARPLPARMRVPISPARRRPPPREIRGAGFFVHQQQAPASVPRICTAYSVIKRSRRSTLPISDASWFAISLMALSWRARCCVLSKSWSLSIALDARLAISQNRSSWSSLKVTLGSVVAAAITPNTPPPVSASSGTPIHALSCGLSSFARGSRANESRAKSSVRSV